MSRLVVEIRPGGGAGHLTGVEGTALTIGDTTNPNLVFNILLWTAEWLLGHGASASATALELEAAAIEVRKRL